MLEGAQGFRLCRFERYLRCNFKAYASFSCWLLFTLMNAYFSGAMTMFFTSSPLTPFQSIQDVMRAHPDWLLLHQRGAIELHLSR